MPFTSLPIEDLRVFFPFTLIGAWLGGCLLMSCMGWLWFARRYPARVKSVGNAHRVPWVKFEFFGWYRRMVWVAFSEEGIYFRPPIYLRPFHRPFLLPWKSVRRIRKKGGFVRSRSLIVEVEDAEGLIRLHFSKAMEDDFFKHYRPARPTAPGRRAFPKPQAVVTEGATAIEQNDEGSEADESEVREPRS